MTLQLIGIMFGAYLGGWSVQFMLDHPKRLIPVLVGSCTLGCAIIGVILLLTQEVRVMR